LSAVNGATGTFMSPNGTWVRRWLDVMRSSLRFPGVAAPTLLRHTSRR
jgi:hypothetical protein